MTSSSIGAWAPLRNRIYFSLWLAMLVSNTGTWMHDIGAGWHMTSLSASPLMVALVQTATTLPMFLLAIPAGALADIFDRRQYLIVTQCWLLAVAATLGVLTLSGATDATVLLMMTLMMGLGSAMMMPAWSAVTPNVVAREQLPAAVALNSLSINVARAIGPALAGIIVVKLGAGAVFLLNAVSYVAVLVALLRWQYTPRTLKTRSQPVLQVIGDGLRYVWAFSAFKLVIARGMMFYVFASALWALLPVVARGLPNGSAATFGLLVAGVGVGAVSAAIVLPAIRRRTTSDTLVVLASMLCALGVGGLSLADHLFAALAAVFTFGFAWIAVLSSIHTAAQLALDEEMRSRALSVYMMSFMGSMAGGSALWGVLASITSTPNALACAAIGLTVFAWPARVLSLRPAEMRVLS
ncbi:MAG: MFS transporter [Pseudomonadota bacterium]